MENLAFSVEDVMYAVKLEANCPKQNDKINEVSNTTPTYADHEHVLMADMCKQYNELKNNTWLCDSGATCHLSVYDIVKINETAILGDGTGLKITKKGKLNMKVGQDDGSTCYLILDVKVMAEVAQQLLSLTTLMQEGWEMKTVQSNSLIKSTIELQCDNKRFKVDQIIALCTGKLRKVSA